MPFFRGMREEYWHAPSPQSAKRVGVFNAEAERMFDLSEIPPAARFGLGHDAIVGLYEGLSRIELPPEAEIPDTAYYADTGDRREAGGTPLSWTIPHTDISLERVAEGPRACL